MAGSLYCATAPEVAQASGLFYDTCAERPASAAATGELAGILWDHSVAWTLSSQAGDDTGAA